MKVAVSLAVKEALSEYRSLHADLFTSDPEFARWFQDRYTPIAGGWMY